MWRICASEDKYTEADVLLPCDDDDDDGGGGDGANAAHRELLMLPIASEPLQRKDVTGIAG